LSSFKFKTICLGTQNKSIILKRFLYSCFNKDYSKVIGCNIFIKSETLDYDDLTFSVWDISALERFRFFRTSFYHGSCAALIFFELKNYDEIVSIPMWINEVSSILRGKPIFLIGYKLEEYDTNPKYIELIQEYCRQFNCFYYEIDTNTQNIDNIFEHVGNLTLESIGYTRERRLELNRQRVERNRKFKEILTEMGFKVINNKNVEILTSKGLFTVNILNGKVYFEHFICEKCDRISVCNEKVKNYYVKKSLCIVRKDDPGWSNCLNSDQLLILSKIFAISEDKLPQHVINQMFSSIHCHYGKKVFERIVYPEKKSKKKNALNAENVFTEINDQSNGNFSIEINNEPNLGTSTNYIKSRLRDLEIRFWNGQIPHSLYFKLKDKYLNQLEDETE